MDRASGFEPEGREFESLRARQIRGSSAIRVRHLCGALIAALALRPLHAADAPKIDWFGYAQLTAEHVADSTEFGADRVRTGFRLSADRLAAFLQLDFNAGDLDERPAGTLANVVKDVYVSWRFHELATVRFGQFKAPVGMDFSLSGHSLDITKRGMEKGLVLERDLGVMLSGERLAERFGYDVGVFNPAGRSAATAHVGEGPGDQVGEDHAWAVRGRYSFGPGTDAQLAVGGSEAAGGPGTEDYEVIDLGLRHVAGPWTLKAEYIEGRRVRGEADRDESVWYVHGGYRLAQNTELVVRHYAGRSELATGRTRLTNTYAGVTHWLYRHESVSARLQANYVLTGGDEAAYSGVSGFRDDAVLLQVQVGYLP